MDEDLLDSLLGDVPQPTVKPLFVAPELVVSPPKPRFVVEVDTKTTIPFVGRRCYGGYQPPMEVIPIFMLPEKPAEVKYDLNMDRIHLRAKEKRDTRIKKQLKKT